MALPHVPTASQLSQLATLNAAEATAQTTYASAVTSLKTAQVAWYNAQIASAQYAAYIYGGTKPGILDEGGANIT